MKQYIQKRLPFVVVIYRKFRRWRAELYLKRIKNWSLQEVFEDAYKGMLHLESASGGGSTIQATERIREEIPALFKRLDIRSMIDAPCGDFNWMNKVSLTLDMYYGCDIVPELIVKNKNKYGNEKKQFLNLDITKDELPTADVILCRDCLVHLSYENIFAAINNFKKSGSKYLLTTTFPTEQINKDIITGDWRPINFCKTPFCLPDPKILIDEQWFEVGRKTGKSIGLWCLNDVKI